MFATLAARGHLSRCISLYLTGLCLFRRKSQLAFIFREVTSSLILRDGDVRVFREEDDVPIVVSHGGLATAAVRTWYNGPKSGGCVASG